MDEFLELVLSPDQRLVFALKDAIPGSGKDIAVLSESLAKIFMYKGKVISLIEQLIIAEVNATTSFGTLFRVNSMASKIMTFWSRQSEGTEYISQVLGKEISQICACKYGSLEINPEHARPEDDIGANVATLTRIEQGVVDSIVGSVDLCPLQFRVVCSYLYRYCSAKFPDQALRAVGGFIILRFFSAAIVAPEANGLAEEAPPLDARRILVLISKTIQNLSNHTLFRESFMEKSFNTFLADNQTRVDGFLRAVAQVPAFAEGMSSEELCSQAAVAAVVATTAVAASGGGSSASAVSSSLTSSDPSSSSSSAVVISQIGKEEFEDALGNLAQLCVKNAIAIENALVGPDAKVFMENVKKTAGPIAAKRQQQLEHEQEKQQKKHGHQSSALENGSGATGANGGSNGSGGGGGGGSGGGGATMLGDGRKSQKALDKKQKELSKIEKIFAKGKKTREDVARKRELREEVKRIYGRQLTQAAGAGDLALVEEILQRDRRMVNATDDSRQTALHAAASGGHVNVVRYLLRCKADCYLQDERGWTALHCAAFENRDDVMEELCKQRHIDFSATNEDENTPLHYFARSPPSSAKPRILCLLLAGGADINARNTLQETPLHMAIWKQNAAMAALLIEHGANAKIPNNKGDTPYDWLYILNNKALTDEVDAAIRTYEARRHRIPVTSPIPVVAASSSSSSSSLSLSTTTTSSSLPSSSSSSSSSWTLGKISRKLHSLSPSPSDRGVVRQPLHPRSSSLLPPQPQPHQLQHTQKNNNNSSGSGNGVGSNGSGSSVREEDSLSSRERLKEEIFMDAVRSGKIEEVKGLLKLDRRLADCSTGPSKNTPLHVAALLGNLAVVKLLLGAATKVPKNTAGWTPLMAALWRGHEAAALSILLSPLHLDVAAKLDDGNTALHLAARNAGPLIEFVLDALLDRGAAIDAPNARGDTPLHCAARGNQADLVKMLVAKGANKGRANKAGETALTIAQKNLFGQVVAVLS